MPKNQHSCVVCQRSFADQSLLPISLFQDSFLKSIQKKYPECTSEDFICSKDIKECRLASIHENYTEENPIISQAEQDVLKHFKNRRLSTIHLEKNDLNKRTFGERCADKVAAFGGSWTFIITFMVLLLAWIALNSWIILFKPFDVYPYIFLNLILSCVAAIQAPIIMMSQNRQEAKDRLQAEKDYKVNLRAALEVHHINNYMEDIASTQMYHFKDLVKSHQQIIDKLNSLHKNYPTQP
jgi:uncharacterized membrane protein